MLFRSVLSAPYPDGRIVVAGTSGGDFAVARYTGGGTRAYAVQDANYNVTAAADAWGRVTDRFQYTAYGEKKVLNPDFTADADGAADVGLPYGFQGLRRDASSGNDHGRNREYRVTLARWTQNDPAGYIDTLNLYAFVDSNPVNFMDAFGLHGGNGIVPTPGVDRIRIPDPAPTPKELFDGWYAKEKQRGLAWANLLPDCPCSLDVKRCPVVQRQNPLLSVDSPLHTEVPVSPDPTIWKNPVPITVVNRKYHPKGEYEMRSFPVAGGHSQQCVYDHHYKLVTGGPSAGTADFVAPVLGDDSYAAGIAFLFTERAAASTHYGADVQPFNWASSADGERFGENCSKYVEVRPTNPGKGCKQNIM